jgi:hypothetical protein
MYLIQHHAQCEMYKETAVQLRSFDVSSLLVNGTECLVQIQASLSNFYSIFGGGRCEHSRNTQNPGAPL